MRHRRLLAVALAVPAALAPAAGADARSLQVTVSAKPYAAGSRTAVPVTFSKSTARSLGVRSRRAVVVIAPRARVASGFGPLTARKLLRGDRLRVEGRVVKRRGAPTKVVARQARLARGASGSAKSVLLKGTVSGAAYVATDSASAVPVIFSKQTARRAGMRSPVGIIVIPRRKGIPSPEGAVRPHLLRLGDRFRFTARVPAEAKRAVYTRLATKKLVIYKRSKTLSTAELEALLQKTRRDLASLSSFVNLLANYTVKGFRDVNARVDGLQRRIEALERDLAALRSALTALQATLDSKVKELQSAIAGVEAALKAQIDALTAQINAINATLGSCSDPASVIGRICSLEAVVSTLGGFDVTNLTNRVDQLSSALTTTVNALTNQVLTGDLPATLDATTRSTLQTIYGLIGRVGSLETLTGTLDTTLDGALTDISSLTTLVGGVDVVALQTTVSGLSTDLTALTAAVTQNTTDITGLETQVTSLQTQANAMQSQLAGTDGLLGTSDDTLAGLQSAVSGLQTNMTTVQAQLDTICTDWRTLLSNQTLGVRDLLGLLTGDTVTTPTLNACGT